MHSIKKFNARLAVKITNAVGSMWCAYAFAILAFISLPQAIHGGISTLIGWIAQTFLQLVLLSIIMVGQKVQGATSEKRAIDDHRMIKEELALMKEDLSDDAEMMEILKTILAKVENLNERL